MTAAVKHRVTPTEAARVRGDLTLVQGSVRRGDWLSRGDHGADVKALQRGLRDAGLYRGPIDGIFGPMTDGAVRSFQKARGLTVDGAVGPQTLASLKANNLYVKDGFETAARVGQSGQDILAAEKKLAALGYQTGKVDGVFDQNTARAVRAFRAREASLPDGKSELDRAVWQRLQQAHQGAVTPSSSSSGTRANNDSKTRAERTIAGFKTTPPKNDYRVQTWRGVKVNGRTREMLQRAEFIMRHKYGHKNFSFAITQGSYNKGGVAASAGTHDGGGALDIRTRGHGTSTVDHMVKAMREAGFAAWSRGRGHDSFAPHIHAIAIGDRQAAWLAKSQVQDYARGRNGLSNHAADPDRALGRAIPSWARRYL